MLDIKFSTIHGYVLLYDKEKVYLVDTIYTNSLFNLPKSPEKVILKTYRLKQNEVSYFEAKGSIKSISSLNIALITQPLTTIIYNIGKQMFQGLEENYYMVIKLILLISVLTITIISSRIYLNSLKKKFHNILYKKIKSYI